MADKIETLLVDVRASTDGFQADIARMRGTLDTGLVDGFSRAGNVLERGLLGALRRGSIGFDDLKRTALQAMDDIASRALTAGIGDLAQGNGAAAGTGITALLTGAVGALFGLPGRATGGPVSPGSAYVVGERGPEMFVPTSAGRIETGAGGSARDVRVSIAMTAPRGTDVPTAMRRSSRQVASTIRRALKEF
ncbi:MAG: hypothetical protein RLZZ08_60 [Pseudomonadota bacterium]|jgi:phage-related minor tail protein